MAVPKRKTTPSRKGMRRSHHALNYSTFVECSNCGEFKLSHHICGACGYYGSGNKQRRVINKIESEVGDDEDWHKLSQLGIPGS